MSYAYYPGCATHGLSKDVDIATRKVFEALGLKLEEVKDWNCCGGGFYDERDEIGHVALNLRNLSNVEKMGYMKMVTPCSVCLHSHRLAIHKYKENKDIKKKVEERIKGTSVKYSGKADAEHIVWILVRDVGAQKIKEKVKRPLNGLRVAAYYGCQMLRPEEIMGFEPAFNPHSMEGLIASTGAIPVTFPTARSCCGFPLMGSNPQVGIKLAYNVLKGAKDQDADILVHPCSLCHLQLDSLQLKVKAEFNTSWTLPAIYITQLLGLAFGYSPDELGISNLAKQVLAQKGVL